MKKVKNALIKTTALTVASLLAAASLTGCGDSKKTASVNSDDMTATTEAVAVTEDSTESTTEIIVTNGSIIETDGQTATMTDSPANASQGVQEALLTTEDVKDEDLSNGIYDIDLTQLSSTMVYSEVYNMMVYPDKYTGKYINMAGTFDMYEDSVSGQRYYACIIADALGCCAQGIEFVVADESITYPENYPDVGAEVAVEGTFEVYEESGFMYCRLKDAKMTF